MNTISMVVALVSGTASVQMDRQSPQAAGFETRHSQRSLTGSGHGLTGTAELLLDGTLQARLRGRVDSFGFGDASCGKFLREALDVKRYPMLEVQVQVPAHAGYFQRPGSREAMATGTVTLRGVTRPIQLLLRVSPGSGKGAQVSGDVGLDLADFGVPALTLLSLPIDPKIALHFEVDAVQDISFGETPAIADATATVRTVAPSTGGSDAQPSGAEAKPATPGVATKNN